MGAVTLVSALALGAVGAPPAPSAPSAAAASGAPGSYAFAEGAATVEGTPSTADAARLEPGRVYRSTLPARGTVYYSLELDAASTAYVSATAVPPAGLGASSVRDGVKVSLQDARGRSCDVDTAGFGAAGSPRPVTASAVRETARRRSLCQEAGTYYVAVERADPDGAGTSPAAWELELAAVTEPPLEAAGVTNAPREWNSASPEPVAGAARRRAGGAGFAQATPLGEGVWRDDVRPGATLFYKVPVDWGQQVSVTAELGSSSGTGKGFVASALDLDLHNPARSPVADVRVSYDGGQKAGSLPPLPPVAHANRHAAVGRVAAMRVAGSYYLVAHLAADVADDFGTGPVPLTLRIRLDGAAQYGPAYAGESVPEGVFGVTAADREAAAEGTDGDAAAMRVLAVSGFGAGSALLLGLGAWTVVARRRAASWRDGAV
ncbi:hypothetical protein [Streptomyces sp. SID8111]|uniref:hypothetical protein n=1 Tax=Streptomyces sp. SID8111 TaxID=2706100 RepID=UPI001944C31C|nr:hypothetical protein [Streptomyces sp. SID8111]